jgi:hypothetical protein
VPDRGLPLGRSLRNLQGLRQLGRGGLRERLRHSDEQRLLAGARADQASDGGGDGPVSSKGSAPLSSRLDRIWINASAL